MKGFLNKLANNEREGSFANKLRKKRFAIFKSLISNLHPPIRIIDIGGTVNYWEQMGLAGEPGVEISLINLQQVKSNYSNITSLKGDARDLAQVNDKSFDIAFSNSVIEHVGGFSDQTLMVNEMRRVSSRVYLQTPNYYFPLEPHFLFPFFQFLPISFRVWLLMNFQLGWYPKYNDKKKAKSMAESVTLLKRKQLKVLFPKASILPEKIFGLTKSFVVIEGF